MIRVMVVEDEAPILRAIVKLIQDYSEDFFVAATAHNGKKALEELDKAPFDLVFTDIKMPVMDGLELAKQIQAAYPQTLTVIISGYQDFAFARKALQFQVFDYLLKPVSKANLFALLEKAEVTITARIHEQRRKEVLAALSGPANTAEGQSQDTYGVLLLCVGPFPLTPDDSMLPARGFWEQRPPEKLLEEVFPPSANAMIFNGKSVSEKIILFSVKHENEIAPVAEAVYQKLVASCPLPVTLTADRTASTLSGASAVFSTLRTYLYTHISVCRSSLLWLNDPSAADTAVFPIEQQTIDIALSAGSPASLTEILEKSLHKMQETHATQMEAVQFLENLLDAAMPKKHQDRKYALYKMDLHTAVSNAVHCEDLAQDVASLLFSAADTGGESENAQGDPLIDEIEEFLKSNFDKNITNTVLSQKFGLVPSYLSKLFRSQKGVSPSEYLTHLRIGTAQRLIRDNPRMLVKEVADQVGYNDQYYFSKIFKKETGVWPSEYPGKSGKQS